MFVTTMRTARILGWGREPRTTEFAPPPRGAFFLRIDWAGYIIVTSGLPDPDQLFAHPYICMPDVSRCLPKENLRAPLKATLNRIQALFSIRGARGIAPFSTRMRFWRDTTRRSLRVPVEKIRLAIQREVDL